MEPGNSEPGPGLENSSLPFPEEVERAGGPESSHDNFIQRTGLQSDTLVEVQVGAVTAESVPDTSFVASQAPQAPQAPQRVNGSDHPLQQENCATEKPPSVAKENHFPGRGALATTSYQVSSKNRKRAREDIEAVVSYQNVEANTLDIPEGVQVNNGNYRSPDTEYLGGAYSTADRSSASVVSNLSNAAGSLSNPYFHAPQLGSGRASSGLSLQRLPKNNVGQQNPYRPPEAPQIGPLEVAVPHNFFPGDRLTVEDPRDLRKYLVTIPPNARPGSILHVNVGMLRKQQQELVPDTKLPQIKRPSAVEVGVPDIRSIPGHTTSSAKAQVDFKFEEMRLHHLDIILKRHNRRIDVKQIMNALRLACPKGQSCTLNEVHCVTVPQQNRLRFYLEGPSQKYFKTFGGSDGFADLVSTVLAHDLSILESKEEIKRRCHLLPPAVATNAELLMEIKCLMVIKLTSNGKSVKLLSLQDVIDNESAPRSQQSQQLSHQQEGKIRHMSLVIQQQHQRIAELERYVNSIAHENHALKFRLQQYEMPEYHGLSPSL